MAQLSIIIVNWNTHKLLRDCLKSIAYNCGGLDYEVIVVDNASSDDSISMLQAEFPEVHIIQNDKNVGFARANNQAMQASNAEYFLLLNSDAFLLPGSVERLLEVAQEHSKAGIVGALLVNPDGSFQASHTRFPTLWREFLILSSLGRVFYGRWFPSYGPEQEKGPQVTDYVEGACLLVRRQAYAQVGGLDESFFMYAEDVDWCYRMSRLNWQVWYQPQSRVVHLGGASSSGRRTQREGDLYWSRVHFFRKHYNASAAQYLKTLMLWVTAVKVGLHGITRIISRGKNGRAVISVKDLSQKLKSA